MPLRNQTVLLGVSGGIAAYKAAELASRLKKEGCDVRVILTQNATEFVAPLTFETLTGNQCVTDTFERTFKWEVEHISLAKAADVLLIAPATANVLAKLANGIADDMLTTTVLAATCPKLVAPSMNTAMYENSITQENLQKLKRHGFTVLEPESGTLACGDTGKGRLPDTDTLLAAIRRALTAQDFAGKRVLVTAGPTQEPIDPVRFITNPSSGKMGFAVAEAAAMRGAQVTLITGKTALQTPYGVERVDVTTAEQMSKAVFERFPEANLTVMTAAVADYRPAEVAPSKIKKSDERLTLALTRNPDILKTLGARKQAGQILCGFSMETEQLLAHSKQKLSDKHLDMIVANDLTETGAGFAVDTNKVTLLTPDAFEPLERMPKRALADVLLDHLVALF